MRPAFGHCAFGVGLHRVSREKMACVIVVMACVLLVSPSDAFAWNPLLSRPSPATQASGRAVGGLCARARHVGESSNEECGVWGPRCSTKSMVAMLAMAGTRNTLPDKTQGAASLVQALRSTQETSIVMERDLHTTRSSKSAPPVGHVVTMGGVTFRVVDLLLLVDGHGGSAAVTEQKLWKSIARDLGVNTKVVHNASTRLRVLHDATMNRLRDAAAADSETRVTDTSKVVGTKRRVRTMQERTAERITKSVRKQRLPAARKARSVKKVLQKRLVPGRASTKAETVLQKIHAKVGKGKVAPAEPKTARISVEKSCHPFFACAEVEEPACAPKGRAKKAKGGTRKGLQKGLESVSSAVALPDEVQDDVNELTRKEELAEYLAEVGVGTKNLDKVLEAYPQLQHLSVIQNLRPTIRFLTKEIGIAPDMVRKVIVSFPQILGLSVDLNLRPTVHYLLHEVGVPMDRLNKTIVTRPQILGCSVDKNLRPKLELLVEMAGIEREQLHQVITRAPHVLGYSSSNIAHFLIFLLHELGVEQSRVARLLTLSPQLLGLSVENNIRPKVRFLVEEVGMSEQAMGRVIGSFPNILGYSVKENMRPKLEYLAKHILKVPMSKLGRPLEKCPQLLGYSLEKRIKPRFLLLSKRGLKLGLSRMLAPTDLEFRRILRIHDAQLEEERRATLAAASAIRAYTPWAEVEEREDEDDEAGNVAGDSVVTVGSAVSHVLHVSGPKALAPLQVCPRHEVRLMDEWVAVVSGKHCQKSSRY